MAVHTPYRSREQRRAAAILTGLVLGALVIWVVAMVTTGSQTVAPDLFGSAAPEATPPASGEAGAAGQADGSSGAGASGEAGADGPGEDGEGAASSDEPDGEEEADPSDEDGRARTIDFDGRCTVELTADEQVEQPRPWQFAACERAPIDLEGGRTAWVAIVGSLSGAEFTEAAALDRLDAGQVLLWSSHYPSLNPGLWVIVEGPFDAKDDASRAARRVGNGAYPRALTDDADDRYCALANGCGGEADQ